VILHYPAKRGHAKQHDIFWSDKDAGSFLENISRVLNKAVSTSESRMRGLRTFVCANNVAVMSIMGCPTSTNENSGIRSATEGLERPATIGATNRISAAGF
jgi:hypothetical protein